MPTLDDGDWIHCEVCGGRHQVTASQGRHELLFYNCGDKTYLAAVDGRALVEPAPKGER